MTDCILRLRSHNSPPTGLELAREETSHDDQIQGPMTSIRLRAILANGAHGSPALMERKSKSPCRPQSTFSSIRRPGYRKRRRRSWRSRELTAAGWTKIARRGPEPAPFLEKMSAIVNQFTFAQDGAC